MRHLALVLAILLMVALVVLALIVSQIMDLVDKLRLLTMKNQLLKENS